MEAISSHKSIKGRLTKTTTMGVMRNKLQYSVKHGFQFRSTLFYVLFFKFTFLLLTNFLIFITNKTIKELAADYLKCP